MKSKRVAYKFKFQRSQRATVAATPDTASKKRKAPEPAKAPPAKKAAPAPVARNAKGKGKPRELHVSRI